MVDLLLVRLTREDEKIKVIDLLMSELGMSKEEAREKVDSSPNILNEGVEMEQGRILQDRMYPFVDLLPRHYNGIAAVPAAKDSETEKDTYEMIPDDIPLFEEENEELHSESEESDELIYNPSTLPEEDQEYKAFDEEDDDTLIITSASEEMLNVERCHICGRTPTGGQKLAPCQICAELTCSDCYNRKHHVCDKCATEGRAVDRPLDSVPRTEIETSTPELNAKYSSKKRSKTAGTAKYSRITHIAIIVILLILVAAFFIIDPMHLLTAADDTEDVVADTTEVDLINPPDTTHVIEVDSTIIQDDSLLADSSEAIEYISLRDVSLPDSLVFSEEYSLPRTITYSRIAGLEIQTDSLPFIAEFLGQLASVYSIEFDGISLVRTEDGFEILLMAILHPEPAEKRTAMLGHLGLLLDSTVVDQMVLYYRENQYYDAVMFTFTADSFSILSRSNSPNVLQRKQAFLPETTDLITGRIFDWMTDLN